MEFYGVIAMIMYKNAKELRKNENSALKQLQY